MFIVEGLDYAGKSTALGRIQQLIRDQRWGRWYGTKEIAEIQRWGKLPPDFDYCDSYVRAIGRQQICDRFVLSELAYGEVFRGGPNAKFDTHARRRVQRALNATGSVTLLVKTDWASTERRAQVRCLSEFDAAMKVRQTYDAGTAAFQNALKDLAIGRRGGSFLGEYDTSEDIERTDQVDEEAIAWYVQQWKSHVERAQMISRLCPKSWGYLWPKILLVGEAASSASDNFPFCGDQGSARTLTYLLDLAGIGEKDLYLWNAYRYNKAPLLTKAGVTALAPKVTVALGLLAHEYLVKLDVPHFTFPHPQWVGRFHRKEMDVWATKLKTLVTPALQS